MKILLGFIVLLVALVAICGCTQYLPPTSTPAPTAATTVPTTITTTVPPTTVVTTVPTTVTTTVPPTTVVTTAVTIPVATTPWSATKVAKIHFNSTGFTPASDIVLPGMGVTWINDDSVAHTIVATGNNTGMFNSGPILPGGNWVYTFCLGSSSCNGEGTITYALQDVPSAQGTIIVQAQQQHLYV